METYPIDGVTFRQFIKNKLLEGKIFHGSLFIHTLVNQNQDEGMILDDFKLLKIAYNRYYLKPLHK